MFRMPFHLKYFTAIEKSVFTIRDKYLIRNYAQNMKGNKAANTMKWTLLLMPITTFGLGCWQVRRREWKLDLIKKLETSTKSPPIDLPKEDLAEIEYHPVKVYGHYKYDGEILMGPRFYIDEYDKTPNSGSLMTQPHANQGWLVITPFQLHDRGEKILINRGWVPNNQKNASEKPKSQLDGEIKLVGIVRLDEKRPNFLPKNSPSQGRWFYRDLDQMGQSTGCAPVWLDLRGGEDMPEGWPLPNQTRVTLRNEHASYIITWFGLSALTSLMWLKRFVQK